MSIDYKLKIGQMPEPCYLRTAENTTGDGNIRWIGMRAFGFDRKLRDFLWWTNVRYGSLHDEAVRTKLAEDMIMLKMEMKAETAVGRPIDLGKSNPQTGKVAVIDHPEGVGIYVEADKRPRFNFMVDLGLRRTPEQLRAEGSQTFQRLVDRVKAVMPYPDTKATYRTTSVGGIEVKIHPMQSDVIILNYPGIQGDIDGYNNKYGQLADFLVEKEVGAVVRMGNQDLEDYPNNMINNFRRLIEYSLANAREISGAKSPRLYLMGFSAGASTIAATAGDYEEVKKILLMAPSGDAGEEAVRRGLAKFRGGVYIVVGENDEIVGKRAGKVFYDMAKGACSKEVHVIPDCDHQFRGERNGRIMSKAPIWAFVGDKTFPDPKGGKVLYT